MKLAWLTDPHLNFAGVQRAETLMAEVRAMRPAALLVSGDIGEAPDLEGWLELMCQRAGCPVYFVLGNHDFYHGSVSQVRADVAALCAQRQNLCWLGAGEVIALTPRTALVGHDGWGDARLGSFARSRVMLADFMYIQELAGRSRDALALQLHALGEEAAEALAKPLHEALSTHEHVLVVTHIPPFAEACWHEGAQSDEEWLPSFTCHAVGELLREAMLAHPSRRATVLCGHTHSGGMARILPNLDVITGRSVYRHPALQPPLQVL